MLPNITSALFGRKRIQPSYAEGDGAENSQNVDIRFLEELQDSISRIENLVKQCNIAWSVETGAYLFPDKAAKKLTSNGSNKNIKSAGRGYNEHSCLFMPFDAAVEKEMVELLRRTAELVVYGEHNNQDLFQYFCERNVLAIIVDILTGLAFATENTMGCTMLPPLSVATQGVQSMAILIQNVANVQSLYLLLANERLNDLINLPLEMYQSCCGHDDADISELSSNFVSFLKSLAMRMNSETLQFFLTFPEERRQSLTASAAHFSLDDDDNDIRVMPAMVEVEFPLYARALEFCTASQDSFVRTTAMNICLNTLRLVVAEHINEDKLGGNGACPVGNLEQVTLSFRDRLIIAHHVCAPERVSALITPISTIIAQLSGWLEDSIRAFDGFAGYMGRDRLRNKVRDTVIDLQEEIVLLDDILKVGISSLNEQAIEMLLATAIYPVMLQPLLFQKKRSSHTYVGDDVLRKEDCHDVTGLSPHFNASINPFSSDDLASKSLLSSGLLDDFENKQQPGNQQQQSKTLQSVILTVPAKTSLVGLITILGSLSNTAFIRMIVTCLFHPFSPDSKEGEAFETTPNMIKVQENGKLSIRLDSKTEDIAMGYDFGRSTNITKNQSGLKQNKKKGEKCVYVLAPAIADIIDMKYSSINTRVNPYRKVLMSGLSGSYYDDDIQPFFVLLVDTAITAMGGSFGEVAFPHDCVGESLTSNMMKRQRNDLEVEDDDSFNSCHSNLAKLAIERSKKENDLGCSNELVEFCECLPRSVMTAPLIISGVWKLFFDDVAANALLALDKKYKPARKIAVDVLKYRMSKAASYLSQIACAYIVDSTLGSHDEDDLTEEEQEERINLFTDELFSNPIDDEGSLIDTLSFSVRNGEPNFSILLTSPSGTDRVVQLACGDFFVPGEFAEVLQDDRHTRICTITSLLSLIQLDAMLYLLRDTDEFSNNEETTSKYNPKHIDNDNEARDGTNYSRVVNDSFESESVHAGFYGASTRKALKKNAPLSPSWCSILYHERGTSNAVSHQNEGAVVSFVGKTALPCVCEVPENFSATVKGVGSFVETNGVRWQSLYMVLLVNVMVLVVPAKGTTGNGRIISCCRISGLSAMNDDVDINGDRKSNNPARRLCLTYETLEMTPPGLFTAQEDISVPKKKRVVQRSYLDLWFQKQSSVDFAYAALQSKITKARCKRGKNLRDHLNHLAIKP